MDQFLLGPTMVSEDPFRLQTNRRTSTQKDAVSVSPGEGSTAPEYAA